jgi:outer membrane lipopolysaccharide assembly protein LptE/RlpB
MKNILILIVVVYSLSACGFKIVNQKELQNFNIVKIETSGDKRINFIITNKLQASSTSNNKQKIFLKLITNKIKSIKEKNIKNEITKYEINISSDIEFKIVDKLKVYKFRVDVTGSYNVSNQYSQTLNNEKQLIKTLTEKILNQILEDLTSKLNDL